MVRDTSIEAYKIIREQGLLSKRRWEIYDVLYEHGPLTGNEVLQRLTFRDLRSNPNTLTRLGELRDQGCVKEIGEKTCSITGMNVILWDVTANLPRELPRDVRKSAKQRLKDLEQRLTKIEGRCTFGCFQESTQID